MSVLLIADVFCRLSAGEIYLYGGRMRRDVNGSGRDEFDDIARISMACR